MAPHSILLPGKSHGRRSLIGCRPWGREESDTTERLHFHFSLSCIGEGNGNPLQCSCLENPRDGGAWWAAIYGVAQSQTRLKRLSSSSSRLYVNDYNKSCLETCFSRLVPLITQQQCISPRDIAGALWLILCQSYSRMYALGKGLVELLQP